ncbi:hypothetical protein TNCT_96591 [Trichonephila clavata]|uniref:Uncharacterized protein n=1 Tax=Trichonephila clavata TaxID=2740835 RepID=A0A8X6LQX3_TRICU|nr:hypothetical protein TNCT_96591 [Trichonephila clavata]
MRRKREKETPQEKELRRESKRLRMVHFRASKTLQVHETSYVFASSPNEGCNIFKSNIIITGKHKEINPKKPPKKKRSVQFHQNKVKTNMRRKRENETPEEQESRRESNRLRMVHLRTSERVMEPETR